jgi:small GTP-binding protein
MSTAASAASQLPHPNTQNPNRVVRTTHAELAALQCSPSQIRNVCILAHVDHGKTTLSDSLISSNGWISERLAGRVRFLDHREDEQLRGITMESHCISLVFNQHLINLVDSPGHVDFSADVSSAVRLCDGAFLVVDVVEGVCVQTHAVMRMAWEERLSLVLVLNKVDRLITELQLSPADAHMHLFRVVEQVNAVMSGFIRDDQMKQGLVWDPDSEAELGLLFAPESGNVVFASGTDTWAFTMHDFSRLVSKLLGVGFEGVVLPLMLSRRSLTTTRCGPHCGARTSSGTRGAAVWCPRASSRCARSLCCTTFGSCIRCAGRTRPSPSGCRTCSLRWA